MVEGQFYTVIPGNTGCIECNHLIRNTQSNDTHAAFLEAFLHSGFKMSSCGLAAHYMQLIGALSSEIARLLTGTAPLISEGKVIAIDFLTYNSSTIMNFAQRQPQCPVCGNL